MEGAEVRERLELEKLFAIICATNLDPLQTKVVMLLAIKTRKKLGAGAVPVWRRPHHCGVLPDFGPIIQSSQAGQLMDGVMGKRTKLFENLSKMGGAIWLHCSSCSLVSKSKVLQVHCQFLSFKPLLRIRASQGSTHPSNRYNLTNLG